MEQFNDRRSRQFGPGSSVEGHPLWQAVTFLLRAGVKPPWIRRILVAKFGAYVEAGLMPPLPSTRTLQRFHKYRQPDMTPLAERQRLVEAQQILCQLEGGIARLRGRNSGRGGSGRTPAGSPVAASDTRFTEKRQRLLAAIRAEKLKRAMAERELRTLGSGRV